MPTDSLPQNPARPSSPSATGKPVDTGLICLLILARFYDLPADEAQLRHLFVPSGKHFRMSTCFAPPSTWDSKPEW